MTGSQEQSVPSVDHDEALLQAWRDGDESALSELLVSFQPRVWSICWRMVRHAEDATDLAQDVLVKVINGLDGFDGVEAQYMGHSDHHELLPEPPEKAKLRRHASLDVLAAMGAIPGQIVFRMGNLGRFRTSNVGTSIAESRGGVGFDEEQRLLLLLRDAGGGIRPTCGGVWGPHRDHQVEDLRARSALRATAGADDVGFSCPDRGARPRRTTRRPHDATVSINVWLGSRVNAGGQPQLEQELCASRVGFAGAAMRRDRDLLQSMPVPPVPADCPSGSNRVGELDTHGRCTPARVDSDVGRTVAHGTGRRSFAWRR